MREDTNIKGADKESDFLLIIYSVLLAHLTRTKEEVVAGTYIKCFYQQ